MNQVDHILLVDDDDDANFFHSKIIEAMEIAKSIHIVPDGKKALEHLKRAVAGHHPLPDLILLDINMPIMDGWDFLEEYQKLKDQERAKLVIIMLTTSLNPDDQARADSNPHVKGFISKYLNEEKLQKILSIVN